MKHVPHACKYNTPTATQYSTIYTCKYMYLRVHACTYMLHELNNFPLKPLQCLAWLGSVHWPPALHDTFTPLHFLLAPCYDWTHVPVPEWLTTPVTLNWQPQWPLTCNYYPLLVRVQSWLYIEYTTCTEDTSINLITRILVPCIFRTSAQAASVNISIHSLVSLPFVYAHSVWYSNTSYMYYFSTV